MIKVGATTQPSNSPRRARSRAPVFWAPASSRWACLSTVLVVPGVGCRVSGVGCRVSGVGCRVSGVGCRVSGFGLRLRVKVFEFGRSRALARTNRDIVTALTIAPAVYVQEYCTSKEYLISSSNVTSDQPSPSHQRSARKNIAPVRNI